MDCHNQQVPIHCRVCGQRLTKCGAKKRTSYECKVFSAELNKAFGIDTSGDDVNNHPDVFQAMTAINAENHQCHHKGSPLQMYSDCI